MSAAEKQLAALREARNAARADLLARYAKVKPLTKPKALGERLSADVKVHSRNALHQAMEIAADNRGVLAGTLTALMLWAARKKLFAGAADLAPKAEPLIAKAVDAINRLTCRKKDEAGNE
jgi:hypothetical protein